MLPKYGYIKDMTPEQTKQLIELLEKEGYKKNSDNYDWGEGKLAWYNDKFYSHILDDSKQPLYKFEDVIQSEIINNYEIY
jgi:hypothetical protein